MEAGLRTANLGKYQLIASLGQGGMANVFLALVAGPAGFNKLLVLKTLREDVIHNIEGGTEMFLDEARLTARMVHPNIVTTYEVGESEGTYFLAMEYLEGQTYRAVCNRGRPDKLPIDDELRVLSETARGLHYAHELTNYDGTPLNVVHRDVSPQNVFITYDGLVKLLDFGIAKTSEAEHMTQVGVVKGKIDYIAPEQLRAEAIDRRADVFALGAMLWEAVTGKRFAGGRKLNDIVKAQNRLSGAERKVREMQPDVPDALVQIVERATALLPDDRYDTAAAFADALDHYLATTAVRPSAKTLSGAIVPLFETERARIRKTVEEQIQISKARGAASFGHNSGTLPAMRAPNLDSISGVWLPPEDTEKQKPRSLAPLASITADLAPPPKPARRAKTALIVVAVGALVGGIAAFTSKQSVTVTPVAVAAPAPVVATPVSTPEAPVEAPPTQATTVRLEVAVSPAEARVTLDGAPLTMPFTGEFRLDPTLHHLEASADGYRAVKQLIAFDRDASLQLTLEKAPAKRGREPVPKKVEPVVAQPAPAEPVRESFAPKAKNLRNLDSEDPYAN